jgi:transcriptional regulator with XRE-family HTH domain
MRRDEGRSIKEIARLVGVSQSTVSLWVRDIIRIFGRFLRECFGVSDERMRICCHLFADHLAKQREVEQFWLDLLGLPRACLRKSMVNNYSRSSKRKRVNRLPLWHVQAGGSQH